MVCGTTAGGQPKNADRLHPGQTAFQALDSPAGIDFFKGTFRQRPMKTSKGIGHREISMHLNNTLFTADINNSRVEEPGGPYSILIHR